MVFTSLFSYTRDFFIVSAGSHSQTAGWLPWLVSKTEQPHVMCSQKPCKNSCSWVTISVSTVSMRDWKPCSPSSSCCALSFSQMNCCSDTVCTGSFRANCGTERGHTLSGKNESLSFVTTILCNLFYSNTTASASLLTRDS